MSKCFVPNNLGCSIQTIAAAFARCHGRVAAVWRESCLHLVIPAYAKWYRLAIFGTIYVLFYSYDELFNVAFFFSRIDPIVQGTGPCDPRPTKPTPVPPAAGAADATLRLPSSTGDQESQEPNRYPRLDFDLREDRCRTSFEERARRGRPRLVQNLARC